MELMAVQSKPAHVGIPSDALRALLRLRDEFPFFRELFGDILQAVMVLDASAVQGELRWRLGSRTNPTARTGLHEAIDAGVITAFAPAFLRQEIEKHLPAIASETGITLEVASAEWQRVQSLINFYAPTGDGTQFALVDPKDLPYAVTFRELEADFVRTTDRHFAQMGVTVVGPELDLVLRDYARSTSVVVTVKLGSGYALTFSILAFIETIRGITEMIRKLPPAAKLILIAAAGVVLLHPTSRAKVAQGLKVVWERLRETKPILVSFSQNALKRLAAAAETSTATRDAIRSKLRVRGKQTALSHARLICIRSGRALAVDEIARRILANGYSSRSKNFAAYILRLLREDGRFVATANGLWTVRIAT
jgi:hypothetical protein